MNNNDNIEVGELEMLKRFGLVVKQVPYEDS